MGGDRILHLLEAARPHEDVGPKRNDILAGGFDAGSEDALSRLNEPSDGGEPEEIDGQMFLVAAGIEADRRTPPVASPRREGSMMEVPPRPSTG